MKKEFKGFIVGTVSTALIMSSVTFGDGFKKNIEVMFNSINLKVNGQKVQADNLIYNGTTYVPLRAAGEILGKEVGWDQATRTASIDDKSNNPINKKEVTVDQVPYKINFTGPDSIGTTWMEATYTNNTSYPMTGFTLHVLRKDDNEITYLSNYDTVMPGQTSSKFDTIGPSTKQYEIVKTEINVQMPNGKTKAIEYDHRLNKYDSIEY